MKYLGNLGKFLITVGTILSAAGGFISLTYLITGIVLLFIGIILTMFWSTVNFVWRCPKCRSEFKITFLQNLLGQNIGVNEKMLYCPTCRKRTECSGKKMK